MTQDTDGPLDPRVFTPRVGTRWVDKQHDVWTMGADGLMRTPETAPFPPEHVARKWGPLKPDAEVSR